MSVYCEGCGNESGEGRVGWAFDVESGGHICPECSLEMQEAWDALTPEQQAQELWGWDEEVMAAVAVLAAKGIGREMFEALVAHSLRDETP